MNAYNQNHPLAVFQHGVGGSYGITPEEYKRARAFLWAAPETAAERDRLKGINAELLNACKVALEYLDHQNHPSNIQEQVSFREHQKGILQAAIAEAEGGPENTDKLFDHLAKNVANRPKY